MNFVKMMGSTTSSMFPAIVRYRLRSKAVRVGWELMLCAVISGAGLFSAHGMAQTAPPPQTNSATQTQRRPDSEVAADVSKKLMASDTLRPLGLGIWVHDGTATLTGTVPTTELRQQAEEMVKSVDGIQRVDDKITIGSTQEAPPGATAGPNADAQNPEGENPGAPGASEPPPPPPSGYASHPQPARITLPVGTPAYVMILQSIDSHHTKPGEPFHGILMQDIVDRDGVIAVPRGANVMGVVIDARGPGHLKGRPELALQLTGLDIANANYPLTSSVWARGGPGKGGQSAANIGGSAAVGAIIGGAVGGGGTALLGGLLGGLGGAGLSALSSGPRLFVPAESVLTFYLRAPLTVRTPTMGEIRMLDSHVPPPANGSRRRGYYAPGYPPPPQGYSPPPPPSGGPPGGYPY